MVIAISIKNTNNLKLFTLDNENDQIKYYNDHAKRIKHE